MTARTRVDAAPSAPTKTVPHSGNVHAATRFSQVMSDRITTRLIGLSLSGIFFAMLMLNAITG
jgi:hypothetical protein